MLYPPELRAQTKMLAHCTVSYHIISVNMSKRQFKIIADFTLAKLRSKSSQEWVNVHRKQENGVKVSYTVLSMGLLRWTQRKRTPSASASNLRTYFEYFPSREWLGEELLPVSCWLWNGKILKYLPCSTHWLSRYQHSIYQAYFGNTNFSCQVVTCQVVHNLQNMPLWERTLFISWLNQSPLSKLWH